MLTVTRPAYNSVEHYPQVVPKQADLSGEILERIRGSVHRYSFLAGHVFYTPDENADSLYLLSEGSVKLYRLSPDGKIVITGRIERDGFFGEMALIDDLPYGQYAEAVETSVVDVISRDDMRDVLQDTSIAHGIILNLAHRANELEYQLSVIALKPVTDRVVAILLYLNRQMKDLGGNTMEIHMTHEELAHMVGANRESVTRVLNDLQLQGVIALHRGSISLLRIDLIRTACQGNVI